MNPRLLYLTLAVLITMLVPSVADAALVSARDGDLASFSGGVQQVGGTLSATGPADGSDPLTFAAAYAGAGSGQASATFKVRWRQGQSVAYGASFYLPSNFHAATSGQQALIRWDSFPGTDGRFQQGGVVIDYSDDSGYLVGATVTDGSAAQQVLAGPFPLPIGTWFTLQIRQLLGSGSAAYSDVYEDGQLVAASRAPTFSGRQITHVRFGIVQLSPDAAQGPASLDFDQASAAGYVGYINPLAGDSYITQRTDMGVDFCLAPGEPIRAVGDGVVVGISPDWFKHQPYIWYQLLDGPYAGRYVYVAEQITRLARVGTELTAGEPLAYYRKAGTCIETGWSAADGSTMAQATTGYTEGQITRAGVSFARFLIVLGVQGPFELIPTPLKPTKGGKPKHPKPAVS
jgi:murein DD-endopeptidase MepM/ murein hydrolase activator NlpD